MTDTNQMSRDVLTAGAKAAPALAVTVATIGGLTLQDWVFIATIGYIVLQAAHLAWKWFREWRGGRVSGR